MSPSSNRTALIREETRADIDAVRAVHEAAFERSAEALLVDALREHALIVCSAVAEVDDQIVANAVFSDLSVRTPAGPFRAVALAPVAVLPSYQRQGYGSQVITFGLKLCAARGYAAAFVVGDPDYYNRFGFSHEAAETVRSPYSKGEAWMALEFGASRINGRAAEAMYPPAFSLVD